MDAHGRLLDFITQIMYIHLFYMFFLDEGEIPNHILHEKLVHRIEGIWPRPSREDVSCSSFFRTFTSHCSILAFSLRSDYDIHFQQSFSIPVHLFLISHRWTYIESFT